MASADLQSSSPVKPVENAKKMRYAARHKIRVITAASLFDGHDAAIGVMRRVLQAAGAEVIHLGHNRGAEEVVDAAIQEDAQAIAVSSYQGGHIEYFKYMVDLLKQKGAKRVLPLPVSAPFHCALMKPAEEKLSPFLDAAPFADFDVPVVTNVDVLANLSGAGAREALRRQVCSPVRWVETVERLSRDAEGAVEVGPGTVLAGLAKRIAKEWPVRTTSDAEGIGKLLAG